MVNTYDIGDVVQVSCAFTQNAVPIDPGTVGLSVEAPDGTIAPYTYPATIIKTGVGLYHVDVTPVLAGTYRYRWVSTGTGAGAEEHLFQVRTRRVA